MDELKSYNSSDGNVFKLNWDTLGFAQGEHKIKVVAYDEVLKIAREKGYAEADPTGDVEGYDARGKVTILANVVMGATNALTFSTDLLGDVTIIGPGAGKIETGFSILTDLLKINNK